MVRESLKKLRERLLRDESVREMIRARAYEIYERRGTRPGDATEDWFQAEDEVLTFLLANESRREELATSAGIVPDADPKQAATKKRATKPAKSKKTAETKPKRAPRQTKGEENSQ
jgi:hypothetical protein